MKKPTIQADLAFTYAHDDCREYLGTCQLSNIEQPCSNWPARRVSSASPHRPYPAGPPSINLVNAAMPHTIMKTEIAVSTSKCTIRGCLYGGPTWPNIAKSPD